MKIVYSPHAQKRMIERRISKSQIRLTLLDPDLVLQSSRSRLIARKQFGPTTLDIIYVVEHNQTVVITLYLL